MPWDERDTDRDNKIIDLYKRGSTQNQISKEMGVSKQRVDQILKRNSISRTDGGIFVAKKIREEAKQKERDSRHIKKYGCSYFEYRRILTLKDGNGNSPQKCYRKQKSSAARRKIEWKFIFYSWWMAWEKSGKWEERGCGYGKYVMGRKDDKGPYSVGNIEIITCSENISNGYAYMEGKG